MPRKIVKPVHAVIIPHRTVQNLMAIFMVPDCCTASGHRIISMLPTFMYAEKGKEFYVNQYVPSQYAGKAFSFEISGNYPEVENMELTVTSERLQTEC